LIEETPVKTERLSDRALYRRSEEMLFEATRLHCSGRRSGLRKRIRRYLKPARSLRARDQPPAEALLSLISDAQTLS
jgi:hypothetical protein